jgi:hypothetical protein
MASSLRLGPETVASPTQPNVLLQQPSRIEAGDRPLSTTELPDRPAPPKPSRPA